MLEPLEMLAMRTPHDAADDLASAYESEIALMTVQMTVLMTVQMTVLALVLSALVARGFVPRRQSLSFPT